MRSLLRALNVLAPLMALAACEPGRPCVPAPGTICTVVGNGLQGVAGDRGPAWAARLYLPMDATLDSNGDLIVVDWNNHRLRRVEEPLGESLITTCAGTGRLGDGPVGPVLEADFNHPTDIVFDVSGRLLIAAWHNSRIRRVDFTTQILEDVAGTGARMYAGDEGPAATAVLDLPAGVEVDRAGNIYIVDQANQVIRRISSDGTITRIAGQCIVNECEDGETPVQCPGSGRFRCGTDPMACMLPCQPAYGGDGGPALQARFAWPFGQSADPAGKLEVADDGTIYVADTRNHRVRRITPDGIITTIAGTGEAGFSGEGGPATEAQLDNPVDVELAADGTLFVADTMNSCIRAVRPDGTIHTVVGRCGRRGFAGDGGPPTQALLDRPYGIELDEASGALYVIDTHNDRIRVVLPAE